MYFSKIIYLFLFIFLISPNSSWAQEFMYFVKGADMKTVSFLEPGSSLGFSSEDVIINGEKLIKRGSVRFTEKYMVYPSTIKSSNGEMDIDVYLSSANTNYNCIIDWGNNTLEQFKLIEVDLASYKKSESKQSEIKKSKYLVDLPLKLENLEKDLYKTEDLNEKIGLISSILNVYINDYKNLFQSDPPEIIKLNQLSNEISSQIEKQKNELISQDKKMDSLRIFNVRVVSFSSSDKSIDTFMVVKRATSLVFYTFFEDSSFLLNNYIDSSFITQFSKKVKSIKILNSTYIDETNYLQICELNVPLLDFFSLGQSIGWKMPSINLSNATVFKVKKYEFLKNQEFNAMCDIIGNLHNLTIECFESKMKKSELSNAGNLWKAKYEIDIIFNEKINDLRKTFLNSCSNFSLNNLDLKGTYKSDANIEKFSIFITPEVGEKSDIVSTNRGNYIQYVFASSMTFDLIKDYLKKLDEFYFTQWSVDIFNKKYFGTQKDMIPMWNLRNISGDKPKNWVYDYFSLNAEYNPNTISIKFPQKSQTITTYSVNLDLKDSDIEKYTDTLKFVFKNSTNYNYKNGGFKATLYTYGVTIKDEGVRRDQQGVEYRVLKYNKPSNDLLPTQLLPVINEGRLMFIYYAGKSYTLQNLWKMGDNANYEICNVFGDTLTREFWSPIGGGKNGNKPSTTLARPTKVEVLYSFYPIFYPSYASTGFENNLIMISYLTGWSTNYSTDNLYLNSIDSYLKELNFYKNYSKKINSSSKNEIPHTGFKILKIEKQ